MSVKDFIKFNNAKDILQVGKEPRVKGFIVDIVV